jgi:hypothetical protein
MDKDLKDYQGYPVLSPLAMHAESHTPPIDLLTLEGFPRN